MKQLSGMDTTFLYLETPNSPMHVGGVTIYEPEKPGTPFDFNKYRDFIESRLHLVSTFRERLVGAPLKLDYPYWVEDPNFNLNFHIHHMALPQPAGWLELRKLAEQIFAKPLDRSRPLWELTFIEDLKIKGLTQGSFAMVSKVHHAAIDGVSGAGMLAAILEPTIKPQKFEEKKPWHPKPLPSELGMISSASLNVLRQPVKFIKFLPNAIKSATRVGALRIIKGVELPPSPLTAPRTRFNVPVSSNRSWDAALFSLEQIKRLKNAAGVTLNDVVLGICSIALESYLSEKNEIPKKSLVAMIPISIRQESQTGTSGNQVSAMTVSLETKEKNLLNRLKKIKQNSVSAKMYNQAIGVKTIMEYYDTVPFALGSLASRLYTYTAMAKRHNPLFNVVITNIPGPQIPLYMNGARLQGNYGCVPILDGIGIILTMFSYAGTFSISVTTCKEIMPDVENFMNHVKSAFESLESAVGLTAGQGTGA